MSVECIIIGFALYWTVERVCESVEYWIDIHYKVDDND